MRRASLAASTSLCVICLTPAWQEDCASSACDFATHGSRSPFARGGLKKRGILCSPSGTILFGAFTEEALRYQGSNSRDYREYTGVYDSIRRRLEFYVHNVHDPASRQIHPIAHLRNVLRLNTSICQRSSRICSDAICRP